MVKTHAALPIYALLGAVVLFTKTACAADRAQNIGLDEFGLPLSELSQQTLPEGNQNTVLVPGDVLGYDMYRLGKVIDRDPLTGTISIDIAGQTVRIHPDTRRIIDVTG